MSKAPPGSRLIAVRTEFQSALRSWYRAHARPLPWRDAPSVYKTVVSEFMLQQTQVKTVLPYFDRWLAALPDFVDGLTNFTFNNSRRDASISLPRSTDEFATSLDQRMLVPFCEGGHYLTDHLAVQFQGDALRFDRKRTNELFDQVVFAIQVNVRYRRSR